MQSSTRPSTSSSSEEYKLYFSSEEDKIYSSSEGDDLDLYSLSPNEKEDHSVRSMVVYTSSTGSSDEMSMSTSPTQPGLKDKDLIHFIPSTDRLTKPVSVHSNKKLPASVPTILLNNGLQTVEYHTCRISPRIKQRFSLDLEPTDSKVKDSNYSILGSTKNHKEKAFIDIIELWVRTKNVHYLTQYLAKFPKGGELHTHLTGAIPSLSYLKFAVQEDLWFVEDSFTFFKKEEEYLYKGKNIKRAYEILIDYHRLQQDYNSRSTTRGKPLDENLATAFFETFSVIESIAKYMSLSDLLTPVLKDAYEQEMIYIETSKGFEFDLNLLKNESDTLYEKYMDQFPQHSQFESNNFSEELLETKLILIWDALEKKRKEYTLYIDEANHVPEVLKQLNFKDSLYSMENPVVVRLNVDLNRELPLPDFFADLALAFKIAHFESSTENPRVLGIVLSGREDNYSALVNCVAQYKMIAFFKSKYDHIGVSVHAGELNNEMVSPQITRSAVSTALHYSKSDRFGHAATILIEDPNTMKSLKIQNKCIEMCLKSNETILGIKPANHHLKRCLENSIPFTLNTDDAGVFSTSFTQAFVDACTDYTNGDISYTQLEWIAKNSIRYSFLKGEEIYEKNSYELRECFKNKNLSEDAKLFLKNSPKAQMQYKLEKQLMDLDKWTLEEMIPQLSKLKLLNEQAQKRRDSSKNSHGFRRDFSSS